MVLRKKGGGYAATVRGGSIFISRNGSVLISAEEIGLLYKSWSYCAKKRVLAGG